MEEEEENPHLGGRRVGAVLPPQSAVHLLPARLLYCGTTRRDMVSLYCFLLSRSLSLGVRRSIPGLRDSSPSPESQMGSAAK